jgi:hypothetical protein
MRHKRRPLYELIFQEMRRISEMTTARDDFPGTVTWMGRIHLMLTFLEQAQEIPKEHYGKIVEELQQIKKDFIFIDEQLLRIDSLIEEFSRT